jgi:hypothetical protein
VRFEPPPGPANVLFVPTGDPAFFQSTYGPIGNFELLVPSFDRVWHFARINDLHEFNWIYKGIVAATGSVLSVAAFQSSYTTPDEIENHFEALMLVQPAHASSEIYFTWFDFGGGWRTPHPVYVDGSPLKNVQAM